MTFSRTVSVAPWLFLAFLLLASDAAAAKNLSVNAGNVYHVDLAVVSAPEYWAAFYGLATPTGRLNFSSIVNEPYDQSDRFAIAPRVHSLTARYAPGCLTSADWLFVSPNDTIFWDGWTSAGLNRLNVLGRIPKGSVEEAGRFFSTDGTLSLAGTTYSNLTWIRLNSQGFPRFDEYVFKDPLGRLVFAVPLFYPAVRGFNNASVNYEVFLPRGPNYTFFHDPRFCLPAPSSPFFGSSPRLAESPLKQAKESPRILPPSLSKPVKPSAAEAVTAETTAPATETVTVVQSPQSAVTAEISETQTVISAVYSFEETGTHTLQVEYPFSPVLLEQGLAKIDLVKTTDRGHRIKTMDDSSQLLTFDDVPDYRFIEKSNRTLVVWVLNVIAGDVYTAQATVQQKLSVESVQRTDVQVEKGDLRAQLFPTPRPPSRLDVQVGQIASGSLNLLALALGLALVALGWLLWQRPWIWNYLSSGRLAYLYHFFVASRHKPSRK